MARGIPNHSGAGLDLTQDDNEKFTYFFFAKEFGWTPSQIREQKYSDIVDLNIIASMYNTTVSKEQQKEINKSKMKSKGRMFP